MGKGYQYLKWDSEVFGFSVARLTMSKYEESYLFLTLKRLKESNYRLVYWCIQGVENKTIRSHGGTLVDEKVTYIKDLKSEPKVSLDSLYSIAPYSQKESEHALLDLAQESGAYSRFRLDPLFPRRLFEKLYNIWMMRSVRREIAHEVLVAKDIDGILCGVVTLGEVRGKGDVGLLAVSFRARGQGIGRLLMANAERYFLKHGHTKAQVVTQRKNTKACHLYESCGYKVEKIEKIYHFWL
jgi:dTDP-4-amino-4,6-dideoxy-D-galactose acyltransferase